MNKCMHHRLFCTVFLVGFMLNTSGCLKTRSQLREEAEEANRGSPAAAHPVQDVQPQGQYVLDEIKSEFTRLEGRVEDIERDRKSNAGKSSTSDDLKKLEARIAVLEANWSGLQDSFKKMQDQAQNQADPSEILKKAQSQYSSEDYEAAAENYGKYLKSSKAVKIEDVTFLRGECYFKLKQYKKAIVEYSKFPEKFGKSKRMPEALFKIGLSFDGMGMKEDAKGFYQELVEKYPKSNEAKKARKKVK